MSATGPVGQLSPVDSLLDLVRNLIPANIVYATFAQLSTWREVKAVAYNCSGITGASIENTDDCVMSSSTFDLSKQVGFVKLDDCPYMDVSIKSSTQTSIVVIKSCLDVRRLSSGIFCQYKHSGRLHL